jgi:hypothetical protein
VRADAISIVAAADGGHTLLANALSSDLTLTLSPGASCPPARPFCGFAVGDLLLVLSADGSWSALDVEAIGADTGIVSAWQGSLTRDYAAGSGVIGAEIRTYYFDAARRELRQTIQNSASLPLVDAVTGVRFTYYGDPRPPTRPRPPAGTANCLYDAAGNPAPLAVLGADPLALIELPLSLFADGPWCGSGDFEYDADLLRVRRIGVRIDLEAVVEWLRADRGPTALSSVADYGLSIGITPPNLGAAR